MTRTSVRSGQPVRPARRRLLLTKRPRQALVFAHVVASLGWMGAGAANVVLAATAAATPTAEVRHVAYLMIDRIDLALVIPLAFAALGTGVGLSSLTRWGLVRHWWVAAKLVLTVVVIAYSTLNVGVWVHESIDATAAGGASPVAGRLVYGAAANIVAFLFMTWVSIAKPWGTIPWGRRSGGAGAQPKAKSSGRTATTAAAHRP